MALRDPFEEDYPPSVYDIGDSSIFNKHSTRGIVTVTFANKVYFDQGLLQNLMCSWKRLKFESFIVVAVDPKAYEESIALDHERTHWYAKWWSGISSRLLRPTNKKTIEYTRFIHKRTRFIEALLHQTDINILLCDADIVWLRNPLTDGTIQLNQYLCDAFIVNSAHRGGRGADNVEPLGGFLLVRNNKKIKIWYRLWTAMAACLQSKEQPAMHAALRLNNATFIRPFRYNSDLGDTVDSEIAPNLCVLHDAYYPTGFHVSSVYNSDYPSMDFVTIAHASIVNKTGKQEWLEQHQWWFLNSDQTCKSNISDVSSGGGGKVQAALPPAGRMPSFIKHKHITNWMKESFDGVQCSAHLTPMISKYIQQVDDAFRIRQSGGHVVQDSASPSLLLYFSLAVMLVVAVVATRYIRSAVGRSIFRRR